MKVKTRKGQEMNGFLILDTISKKSKSGKSIVSYYSVKCLKCGKKQEKSATTVYYGTGKCDCSKVKTHGQYGTRLYHIYAGMKQRTQNVNQKLYKYYGGRGVKVCDEWLKGFETFYKWAIESGYNDGLTLDRIDNEKDYSPENCRWVDMKTQSNNRRSNRLLTCNGETKTVREWEDEMKVRKGLIENRLARGWSDERAILTPPYNRGQKNKKSEEHQ